MYVFADFVSVSIDFQFASIMRIIIALTHVL